jgi:hypothetical protein
MKELYPADGSALEARARRAANKIGLKAIKSRWRWGQLIITANSRSSIPIPIPSKPAFAST